MLLLIFLRNKKEIINKINNLQKEGKISVTTISLCELYKGLHLSNRAQNELFILDNFAQSVKILDLNWQICRKFGEMYNRLEKNGRMINELDIMIASITEANNVTLITQDKDFKNMGIRVKIW